jgi:hypothetical protein
MVVADVEGHVAAMGDGCSEVGWQPARGFWKNVRTQRTQPVGRGPMEIMRGRVLRTACRVCGGVGGCRPPRTTGQWRVASALEWAVHGICTTYRSGLRAFPLGRVGNIFWVCGRSARWRGKIRDGTGKTHPFDKLPQQAGAGRAGSQGLKSVRENLTIAR